MRAGGGPPVATAPPRPSPELPHGAVDEGTVRLASGRRLAWRAYGRRGARPVLYCHGFLGSRLEPGAVGRLDADLVAFDRPGYGGSEPLAEPGLLATAAALLEGASRLGLERFALCGVSGGAPYALACCHLAPRRVRRLALVAGLAGPEVIAAAGGLAMLLPRLAASGPLLPPLLPLLRAPLRRPRLALALLRGMARAELPRRAAPGIADTLAVGLHASLRESLAPGTAGVLADIRALGAPWGFDPREVACATLIVHGRHDRVVPPAHAEHHRRVLPRVAGLVLTEDQHVSAVVNNRARILAWLAEG